VPDNGVDGMTSVEDVIDDKQAVSLTTIFDKLVHAMNTNVVGSPINV
jgi:hypothetical protein